MAAQKQTSTQHSAAEQATDTITTLSSSTDHGHLQALGGNTGTSILSLAAGKGTMDPDMAFDGNVALGGCTGRSHQCGPGS